VHVLDRVDRDANATDLSTRARRIGVDSHLRRKIERHRESRLTGIEEESKSPIRLLRRAESRVLTHRPEAATIHRALDTASEWELAGVAEVSVVVYLGSAVDWLDLDA
jgi:hypothetical protein